MRERTKFIETFRQVLPAVDEVSSPVQIWGGADWKTDPDGTNNYQEIATGYATAAIKKDGSLWLAGINATCYGTYGTVGNNSSENVFSPVQTVSGGLNWKQVSASYHTAAIKTDGTLWSWGCITGDNTSNFVSSPVQTIAGGTNWSSVSAGPFTSLALKTDGTLWLWGREYAGILGNNSVFRVSSPIQTVAGGTNWKQVSSGSVNTAVKTDGTLWLWGNGRSGALGTGNIVNRSSPVQTISSGTNWKQVSASTYFGTAAIKTDGTLWLWGRGISGELGNNSSADRSSPVQTVAGGTNWKQVSAGYLFTGAVKTDGTLWMWGLNNKSQLGDNTRITRLSPIQTAIGGTSWSQVCTGRIFNTGGIRLGANTLALKEDGSLWGWGNNRYGNLGIYCTVTGCADVGKQLVSKETLLEVYPNLVPQSKRPGLWMWGSSNFGQLGNNSTINQYSPVQTIAGGTNWKQVSLGISHSSAIKTDGTLWTWGQGSCGALGNNSLIDQSSPVQTISGGNDWKQVSLGRWHSSAIKTDGTLWLWGGRGTWGALGNNNLIFQSSPVQTISGGTNWKQVSLGGDHSSAIKTDGTLWLWGRGVCGILGNNSDIDLSSPVQTISGGNDWKQVSLSSNHSSAIKTDGTLWLWGLCTEGQLGNGVQLVTNVCEPSQLQSNNWKLCIQPENDIVDFDAKNNRSSAIKTDGTLWLWGDGLAGQLGNNSTSNRSSPVQTVSGGTNWKQVSLGDFHFAAIKTDGTLWLWGNGLWGTLGINSSASQSSPVQTISSGTNWKQVSLGCDHSSAIKTDGTLWLWGFGSSGKLGNNSIINQSSPVQTVSGGTNWKQVSLGGGHSSAIKTDGTLWLWGRGSVGNLGTNTTISQSSPVQTISGGTNWKQVSLGGAGGDHSSAIKTDGTLWMWGNGSAGRLGNNSAANQSSPVQTISGGTNWKQVSLGSSHSSAIKTDGTLWLWGFGSSGRLGTNNLISQSSPVQTISGGTNWCSVSAGFAHTLAAKNDNTLFSMGSASSGQLGLTNINLNCHTGSPVQTISGGSGWKEVSIGDGSSGAIKTDGTLWLWGRNFNLITSGAYGNSSSPAQIVTGGTNWKKISVNSDNNAAIKTDGTLWLWGCRIPRAIAPAALKYPIQFQEDKNNWKDISAGACNFASIRDEDF
jgi:alpha-tubulin suppressor-like RCC1 family protein